MQLWSYTQYLKNLSHFLFFILLHVNLQVNIKTNEVRGKEWSWSTWAPRWSSGELGCSLLVLPGLGPRALCVSAGTWRGDQLGCKSSLLCLPLEGYIKNTEKLSYGEEHQYKLTVTAYDCGKKRAIEDVLVKVSIKPACTPGWQGEPRSGLRTHRCSSSSGTKPNA